MKYRGTQVGNHHGQHLRRRAHHSPRHPPETVEVYAREGKDWNSLREEVCEKTKEMVEEVGSDIGLAALEHEENIVEGEPVEKFLHVIKLHDIDFVVISTHGRTGISHALMGALRKSSWQNRRSRCSR